MTSLLSNCVTIICPYQKSFSFVLGDLNFWQYVEKQGQKSYFDIFTEIRSINLDKDFFRYKQNTPFWLTMFEQLNDQLLVVSKVFLTPQ